MGFRVEEVTEAHLPSDVFVACLFQHLWRGLAELSPSALSFESRNVPTAYVLLTIEEQWEWGGDQEGWMWTSKRACK